MGSYSCVSYHPVSLDTNLRGLSHCHGNVSSLGLLHAIPVTPQKYPRIFIIIFIIYSGYELSQTWVFSGKIDKLTNCEM